MVWFSGSLCHLLSGCVALAKKPALCVLQFSHQEVRKLTWGESYRDLSCGVASAMSDMSHPESSTAGEAWISRTLTSQGTLGRM